MSTVRRFNADALCDALKSHEHDHGQLPPHLSSLVPEYITLNNAGALFGPTNYPQFVQNVFRRTVKSVEDAKAADEHGPYIYLGYTNHSSQIIMFERPTAWESYPVKYWAYGQLLALHRDYSATMVSEEQLRVWGIWPTLVNETTELKINQQALQCIFDIKSELVAFSKEHPAFKEITKSTIRVSYKTHMEVDCKFEFRYRVKMVPNDPRAPLVFLSIPEDDGVLLEMVFSGGPWHLSPMTEDYETAAGNTKAYASYYLVLGKHVEDSKTPVKAIVEKHLNQFCDRVKQMGGHATE